MPRVGPAPAGSAAQMKANSAGMADPSSPDLRSTDPNAPDGATAIAAARDAALAADARTEDEQAASAEGGQHRRNSWLAMSTQQPESTGCFVRRTILLLLLSGAANTAFFLLFAGPGIGYGAEIYQFLCVPAHTHTHTLSNCAV